MGLNEKTVHEILSLYQSGDVTPTQVVADLYQSIEAQEETLNSFVKLLPQDDVAQQAEAAPDGPLKGIPIVIKDLISTQDIGTTAGSQILKDFVPIYDATVIQKLKTAGAVVQAKANLDEYGMGSSNENSSFGPVRNPHNPDYVAGGSSGGSAAAVAAHEALVSLGTDTGGSIRLPAAFCGVVGLKPTYGRVSRYGQIAYASSLDQIGPVTKNVRDAALIMNVIAGHDPNDTTSLNVESEDYLDGLESGIEGFRIGIPAEYQQGLNDEAKECLKQWQVKFESLGATFVDVALPHTSYAIAAYYLISCSEASTNLSRFDGVRYTTRVSDHSLNDMFSETRDQCFGEEVKRRIMLGTYALSSGYYDAFYKKAQQVRTLITKDFNDAFEQVDLLLAPTSPTPAFKLGEKTDDPVNMYLSDVYTVSINLAGVPAISIPGGRVDGMPFGLQLIGDHLQESKILRASHAFEQSN